VIVGGKKTRATRVDRDDVINVMNVVNLTNVVDVAEKENDVGEMRIDKRERFPLLLMPISHVT
jgi:hypothetical protein